MTFNPAKHHRRSLRLRGYDYAQAGAYFITVCAYERACLFGEVLRGKMVINNFGRILEACWREIPAHFPDVALDAFVVMPNHIHGVVLIDRSVGASHVGARHALPLPPRPDHASPLPSPESPGSKRTTLGVVVGSFKSACTKRINESRSLPGTPVWQRNYYERILRSEDALNTVRGYIQTNPARWKDDRENTGRRLSRRGLSRRR